MIHEVDPADCIPAPTNVRGSCSTPPSNVVFRSTVNTLTGKAEWMAVDGDEYDFKQELARSAFGDMLHDHERNERYSSGLKTVIEEVRRRDGYVHVLDIGTGTGLLSMLAVTHGADRVTTLEAFAPMAVIARKIIARNRMSDKITLIDGRSTETAVEEEEEGRRPNVCVAEVFDTELIGEGALRTFQHAKQSLLAVCGHTICRVFVLPVRSPLLASYQHVEPTVSIGDVVLRTPDDVLRCPGVHSVHDVQISERFVDGHDFEPMVDQPILAFEFDFESADYSMNSSSRRRSVVTGDGGRIDALLMWWEVDMTGDRSDVLSMAPTFVNPSAAWRDHWMHAVYHLPHRPTVIRGDVLSVGCNHDEHSMWFTCRRAAEGGEEDKADDCPMCTCRMHTTFSRCNMARFNDSLTQTRLYNGAVRSIDALANHRSPHIVCLGECSMLPLLVALFARDRRADVRVTVVDGSSHSRLILRLFVDANDIDVTIVEDRKEVNDDVTAIVAEPHYQTSVLPWHNLRLWHEMHTIRRKSPNVVANVVLCRVRCLPVYLHDLYKIRAPVLNVMGYDVSQFDDVVQKCIVAADDVVEAHAMCEYASSPCASAVVEVLDVSLSSPPSDVHSGPLKIDFTTGRCNALIFWCEWLDDGGNTVSASSSPSTVDLTSPTSVIIWSHTAQQGVYFLDDETRRDEDKTGISLDVSYNCAHNHMTVTPVE